MSQRNPNLTSAVGAALYCLLFVGCLIAALVLPGGWYRQRAFGFTAFALFVIGIPILLRVAERSRIREAVRKELAQVISLRRLPFWQQGWKYYSIGAVAPKYEVVYEDYAGHQFRAICRSGFLRGVEWLEVIPLPDY